MDVTCRSLFSKITSGKTFAGLWTWDRLLPSPTSLQTARKSNAAGINRRIAKQLQALDSVGVFTRLARHDVPATPIIEPSELALVPQFVQRGKLEDGAQMPLARYPVKMAGAQPYGPDSAPELGRRRE